MAKATISKSLHSNDKAIQDIDKQAIDVLSLYANIPSKKANLPCVNTISID